VSDCTANYRPVLSSERVPYMKKQVIARQKEIKILLCVPKGGQILRWTQNFGVESSQSCSCEN
jgi:hypothetical protein